MEIISGWFTSDFSNLCIMWLLFNEINYIKICVTKIVSTLFWVHADLVFFELIIAWIIICWSCSVCQGWLRRKIKRVWGFFMRSELPNPWDNFLCSTRLVFCLFNIHFIERYFVDHIVFRGELGLSLENKILTILLTPITTLK